MLPLDKAMSGVFEDFGIWKLIDRFTAYFFTDTKMSIIGIFLATGVLFVLLLILEIIAAIIMSEKEMKRIAYAAVIKYEEMIDIYLDVAYEYKKLNQLSFADSIEKLDDLYWEKLKLEKKLRQFRIDYNLDKYFELQEF